MRMSSSGLRVCLCPSVSQKVSLCKVAITLFWKEHTPAPRPSQLWTSQGHPAGLRTGDPWTADGERGAEGRREGAESAARCDGMRTRKEREAEDTTWMTVTPLCPQQGLSAEDHSAASGCLPADLCPLLGAACSPAGAASAGLGAGVLGWRPAGCQPGRGTAGSLGPGGQRTWEAGGRRWQRGHPPRPRSAVCQAVPRLRGAQCPLRWGRRRAVSC